MKHAYTHVILLAGLEVFRLAKKIALPQHIHFEGLEPPSISAHARPPKDASSAPAVAQAAY